MSKLQKIALCISVFVMIHYALHILLGFDFLYTQFYHHSWMEKLYAFIAGLSGFINLLLFEKKE